MNSILKCVTFAIFCCLFLIPTASAQDKTGVPAPTPKTNSSSSTKNSEIVLPDVEGWEKGSIQTYPTPELGYSVTYKSVEGGTVTVYVYDAGLKNIPNGIAGDTVKNEMERAKNDIKQAGKMGYYQDVKELIDDTVTLGGNTGKVKALRSLLSFSRQGQSIDSEIYLFGYQKNFIKIRASRAAGTRDTASKSLAKLFAEIDTLFAK